MSSIHFNTRFKIFQQPALYPYQASELLVRLANSYYEKYCIKYGDQGVDSAASIPPQPQKAKFHQVDIASLELEDVRTFGSEHLCQQVLDQLALKECLSSLGIKGPAADKALISIAARGNLLIFCLRSVLSPTDLHNKTFF